MIILKGKAKLFGGKVIIQKLITVQTVAKLFLFLLFILLKNIKRVKKCDVNKSVIALSEQNNIGECKSSYGQNSNTI